MQTGVIRGVGVFLFLMAGIGSVERLAAEEVEAELLLYRVNQQGQRPYQSRMVVTSQAMRIDQGDDTGGFILFDRGEGTIYSVNYEERTILVIDPEAGELSLPEMPKIEVEALETEDLPLVDGKKPQYWRMLVDGYPCQEAMLLPGVMAESLAAQGDYLRLLAEQHKITLAQIPAAYRDVCADAVQVYAPTALLAKGLPLRVWDINGNQQILMDYAEAVSVPADLFTLPQAFHYQPMPAQ
jgi:hypothetical protein